MLSGVQSGIRRVMERLLGAALLRMKLSLLTPAFLSLAASPTFAAQSGSEIHVLGQDGTALVVLVDNNQKAEATLRIKDGPDTREIRVAGGRESRYRYEIPTRGNPLAERILQIDLRVAATGDYLDADTVSAVEPLELDDAEPGLTLTTRELMTLRKNWSSDPRTKSVFDKLKQRCDRRLGNRLLVPKTGGSWPQLYRCPDTHVRLEMIDFHTHRSPATGKVFTGSPYDEAITTYRHKALGVQAFEMALLYHLTGDMRYAERAEQILMIYAHRYPNYELHDRFGTQRKDAGRAFSQTLEEAQWLVDLVRARDLLRGTGLIDTYEDHTLRTQLWEPAIAVIQRNNVGIYNIQCWHNTALFLAGTESGDYTTAFEATYGTTGLVEQLAQGIRADGIWNEGSIGYHFFAIRGMLPMIHAIERTGVQADYTAMKQMFLSAWDLVQPNFTLPLLNDGALESAELTLRDEYEQAYALFPNEPAIDDLLAAFGRGKSLSAVLWGSRDLPEEGWEDLESEHLADTGLGVLRTGPIESRTMALVDYGPHGGYHGHYDKLGLTLWMHGGLAIREAGSDGYGQSISEEYFRSTLAHSTVVVDGANQLESSGTPSYFDTSTGTTLSTTVTDAYPGVTMRRLVHVTEEGHAADMFEATGTGTHTFDYVLHGSGNPSINLTMTEGTTGFGGAYSYLRNVKSATTDDDIVVTFTHEGITSKVTIVGEPGTTVFLADSPGAPIGSTHPILIVRRTGTQAVFAAGFTEGTPTPGFDVDLDTAGWEPKLEVQRPGATDLRRLSFDQAPGI